MMLFVKKILIPIDRSEYKNKIVEYAFSLSKAWQAEITAIHVIDIGQGVGYDAKDNEIKSKMIQEEKKCAEDLLNEIDLTAKKEELI
jgi:nucleotide-binding universal stress UspA family protein